MHDRLEHRVVAAARVEVGEEAVAERGELFLAHLGRHIAEVVDDVVGVAAEPVQRVHVVALDAGQRVRRPVVGRAVALVERAAQLVRLVECRHRPSWSTRSAASRPEISTIGTPTPGTVLLPANTSPGARLSTLFGRNGPVWKNRCDSANGVPLHALALPLERIDDRLDLDVVAVAERGDLGRELVACLRALLVPVDAAVEVRRGLEHVQHRAAVGRHRRLVDRRHGDEDRRVGHARAVVQDGAERVVPLVAEVDVVVRRVGGRFGRTPACHTRHDGE